jgi:hypothetical protein
MAWQKTVLKHLTLDLNALYKLGRGLFIAM